MEIKTYYKFRKNDKNGQARLTIDYNEVLHGNNQGPVSI